MRLIVTGGAGFVGSSLCLTLAARHPEWEIVALDNLHRRGSELNVPRLQSADVEFLMADVREPEQLVRAGGFDALVECSAEPSVLAAGDVIVPVNLLGAYNCFELAKEQGAHVVFLSTSRVYPVAALESLSYSETATRFVVDDEQRIGGASAAGITEQFPLGGRRTMYGASKLAAEILLAEYDFPWVVDRFGVIAGPWQMGKVDQGVFTHWLLSAYFGRALDYIGYGGHGKQVRDLLHIADAVDLIERQLLEPEHFDQRTFNVGGGPAGSLSLLEATAICAELCGRELQVGSVTETRPGDVRSYISDCSALFAHTDWRPSRDPRAVLSDTWDWIGEHAETLDAAL